MSRTTKQRTTKMLFIILMIFIPLLSIGYSALSTSLNINGDFAISGFPTLYNVLANEANIGTYAKEYVGTHQDSISGEENEKIYHWWASSDANGTAILNKNNVIFGGFCWQILRTTDTGDVRLLYNGEPTNGQCLSTRTTHKGIIGTDGTSMALNSSYVYGNKFDYNPTSNTFTVRDNLITKTWSDANNHVLIGKYSCLNGSNTTCSTLYQINGYMNSTTGYVTSYTIGNTVNYSEIGTSPFNANPRSPAMVGYKFNTVNNYLLYTPTGNAYFGTGVTWNGSKYTLTSLVKISNNLTTLSTHHYTCITDNLQECTEVGYVFYYTGTDSMYYIKLTDGVVSGTDALNTMLNDSAVNRYNSSIKGIIDSWYQKNMLSYDSYIKDTVYCNDRTISSLNGWNPNGGDTTAYLYFNEDASSTSLSCTNLTDRFSTSNSSALLTYKVGLPTFQEMNLLNSNSLRNTGSYYWLGTPNFYSYHLAHEYIVSDNGTLTDYNALRAYGVRPLITIQGDLEYSDGTGEESNPYIIQVSPSRKITLGTNNGDGWTSTTCSSPYILYDGECSLYLTGGDTYGELPTPTNGVALFLGWFTDPTGGVEITSTSTVPNNDQQIYAHWNPVYTITFNANGGTGTMASQTENGGLAFNLNANTFTRSSYAFAGWATSSTGAVFYRNKDSVTLSGDLSLFAVWGSTTPSLFYYTGARQTFTPPYSGVYKIELWGAQGGRGREDGKYTPGGRGNRVIANIELTKGTTYGVYVGGGGGDGGHTATKKNYVEYAEIISPCDQHFHSPGGLAGWNGGGAGSKDCSGGEQHEPAGDGPEYYKHDSGGGGGGATDFRTGTAASTRILVAGGGAGSMGWDTAYSNADVLSNSKVATNSNSATHTSNSTGETPEFGGQCGVGGGGGGYYGGKAYSDVLNPCGQYSYNGTNYVTPSANSSSETNRIWGCNAKNDNDAYGSTCTSAYACHRYTDNKCGVYDGFARITFVGG